MEALARRSAAPFQNHLCTAHRLNPRQSRWELHLERFNFTLSYKSGARNIKPDALSCQFSPNEGDFGEETILPSACVVGVTRWEEDQIWQAEQDYRVPKNCPTDRLSLSLPSPLFFNGGMLLRSHAIQVFIALWNYSNSTLDFVLRGKHHHPHHCGPVLQNGSLHTSTQATFGVKDRFFTGPACLLTSWYPPRYCFRSGPQFIMQVWRSFCQALGTTASLFRLSSTI